MTPTFEPSAEQIRSSSLLKEATALKKTDIRKAVQLIKEAIAVLPDHQSTFKLATYLHDAGEHEEGYSVLDRLLVKFVNAPFSQLNDMMLSLVHEQIAIANHKSKQYFDYLVHVSLGKYHWFVGLAVQGRLGEIEFGLSPEAHKHFYAHSKVKKAVEQIRSTDNEKTFYDGLVQLISAMRPTFDTLISVGSKVKSQTSRQIYSGESTGEYEDSLLRRDSTYMTTYKTLSDRAIRAFVHDNYTQN